MIELRYAYKIMARDGESVSGDAVLARLTAPHGMFALIDALGHGDTAHRVAQRGLAALTRLPAGASSLQAMQAMHTALHGTRGCAATICVMNGLAAELIGIGNVACRTIGEMPFVPLPGVIGGSVRKLAAIPLLLHAGQRLYLHSDGISHRFDLRRTNLMPPEEACAFIMRHQRYAHDDASVLVIDAGAIVEGKT